MLPANHLGHLGILWHFPFFLLPDRNPPPRGSNLDAHRLFRFCLVGVEESAETRSPFSFLFLFSLFFICEMFPYFCSANILSALWSCHSNTKRGLLWIYLSKRIQKGTRSHRRKNALCYEKRSINNCDVHMCTFLYICTFQSFTAIKYDIFFSVLYAFLVSQCRFTYIVGSRYEL